MQQLIESLFPPREPPPILEFGHLLGEEGKIKRSILGRLRDAFFEPKAAEIWHKIRQAAIPYLVTNIWKRSFPLRNS
jgi:hypothetical protein